MKIFRGRKAVIGFIIVFCVMIAGMGLMFGCSTDKNKPDTDTDTERTRWEKTPEPTERQIFTWHVDKECLEIGSGGTSIIVETDFDFAQAIADAMGATLIQTRTRYVRPEVAPKVTHSMRGVAMSVRKDPKYRESHADQQNVTIEWVKGKRLEISSRIGWLVAIEQIDLDFATEIADGLKAEKRQVERHTAPDVAPVTTDSRYSVNIKLWKYPQHPDNR